MPRTAAGPPHEGPIWDEFLQYWADSIDGKGLRAAAWRAFHAGYVAATEPAEASTDVLPTD